MICPFCGKPDNPANARFCSHCGTALLANQGFPAAPALEPTPAAPEAPVEPAPLVAEIQAVSQIAPPESNPEPARPDEPIAAAAPTEPLALPASNPNPEPPEYVAATTAQEPGSDTSSGGVDQGTPPPDPSNESRAEWIAPPPSIEPSTQSRYWAAGAHASAFAGAWFGGIPSFVGPLVVWLARKDKDPFAAEHGRNALNFNLSVLVYVFAMIVFSIATIGIGLLITIPGFILLGLAWIALTLVGTIKAANSETYRYPLTIRFVK